MKFPAQLQPSAERKEAQTDSKKQKSDDDFIDSPVFMGPGYVLNPVNGVQKIFQPKSKSEEKNGENKILQDLGFVSMFWGFFILKGIHM